MRLTIEHTTHYHYNNAPKYLIQLLRLAPRSDAHQRVLEWQVLTPGKLTRFVDAFGNISHTHRADAPNTDLTITVRGVVDVMGLHDGVLAHNDALNAEAQVPEIAYRVPTDLTAGFPAIEALAQRSLPQGLKSAKDALILAKAVQQALPYAAGSTDVQSTAQQAFEGGKGVCQDHAHLMIAACRSVGQSARYVSGYVDPGNSHAAASHAWVDVWVNDAWVSVDVTNGMFASDAHCRLAVGRDYLDACPIRGIREGGGFTERMDVSVTVQALQQ